MNHRDDTPPMRVKLPADVDREDNLIGSFTARQVIILGATALLLWMLWALTVHRIPVAVFASVATPVGAAGFMLAAGRRDGIGLDRWLLALLGHRRRPRRLALHAESAAVAPKWVATTGDSASLPVAPLKLPARGITQAGLVDLGPDGTAGLVECSTVNFHLRSNTEQHALVGGYARWLNSLDAPVQILIRSRRVDLTALADRLDRDAASLADPALEDAARYHAAYLRHLAAQRQLLHRDVTVILRDTRSPAHTAHRAAETARALAACEITATVADQQKTAASWAQCVDAQPPLAAGRTAPDAVIRANFRSLP